MRIILCFLLSLVAAPAWAGWVEIGETDISTYYIDPTRIRKSGNFRKVWEIQDRRQRGEHGEMSWRAWAEYDCKEERNRVLALSTHSEPMARGETLSSHNYSDGGKWSAIPPDSIAEVILQFVCGK